MSMLHPGRDMLLAHADGELSDTDSASIAAHLAGCAVCAECMAELRSSGVQFGGALLLIDRAEPASWGGTVALPAQQPQVIPWRPREAHRPRVPVSAFRWAAGILLTAGAASAAIMGGGALLERIRTETEAAPQPTIAPEAVAAVVVAPVSGALTVHVAGAGADARVIVVPEDRTDAVVSVEGGDAPHFTPGAGRLDVDLRGASATLRITLPRNVSATVVSGGLPLITVRDGVVQPAHAATEGVEPATGTRPQRE